MNNEKHRFSNSARTRQQVLELAGQPTTRTTTSTRTGETEFRGIDWLMGRRSLFVVPGSAKPETLIRYSDIVLEQQEVIMRRLFWWGFLLALATGVVAGAVGAAMFLVK